MRRVHQYTPPWGGNDPTTSGLNSTCAGGSICAAVADEAENARMYVCEFRYLLV